MSIKKSIYYFILLFLFYSCNSSQKEGKLEVQDFYREVIPFELVATGDIDSIKVYESGPINENNEAKIIRSTLYAFNKEGKLKLFTLIDSTINVILSTKLKYKDGKKIWEECGIVSNNHFTLTQKELLSYHDNLEIWLKKSFQMGLDGKNGRQIAADSAYIKYGEFIVETNRIGLDDNHYKLCKYDSCGNEIESEVKQVSKNVKINTLTTSEYDKKGMLIKKDVIIDMEGQPKVERHDSLRYQKYDEHNNWTEQIFVDEDGIMCKLVRREITYRK